MQNRSQSRPWRYTINRHLLPQWLGPLCLHSALLHTLLALLLTLLVKELALLICAQAAKFSVTLLLLQLVGGQLALLGLLVLIETADLGDLLLARLPDASQGLGAEVGRGHEEVGQAQELREDGEGRLVGGLELQGQVDALAGLCVIETEDC
jgi:hypothetical protein